MHSMLLKLYSLHIGCVCVLLRLLLVTQVEVALYSANTLLSKVSLIGEEATLKEKVALMLQPAYILKGEPPPPPPLPPPSLKSFPYLPPYLVSRSPTYSIPPLSRPSFKFPSPLSSIILPRFVPHHVPPPLIPKHILWTQRWLCTCKGTAPLFWPVVEGWWRN